MASQYIRAQRRAEAFERLEAVRARLSALLQLADSPSSDIPVAIARDPELFQIAQIENIATFLEGAFAQVNGLKTQIAEKDAQIADLSEKIAQRPKK